MNPRLIFKLLLTTVVISLTACHSKKALLKDSPSEVVVPKRSIAEKYAALLQVDPDNIQNGRLYSFIEEWAGTPYQFGGLSRAGIDCSGLAFLLQQDVYGIHIPRMTSQQVQAIKRKYEDELQEGDLVFFDFDGKQFSHVGIYLQNGYMVHASTHRGVIIVNLHDPSLYKYFSRGGSVVPLASVTAR